MLNRAYAETFSLFVVYANRVGFEDGVGFWGGSEIVDPFGRRLAKGRYYEEDLLVAEQGVEVAGDGQRVGLWYFDPYAREGKRSGAWMSEYRTQEGFKDAVTPIVSNNSNFVKGKAGAPVLDFVESVSLLLFGLVMARAVRRGR